MDFKLDFKLADTMAIMAKTLPFIMLRLAIYFSITIAYVIVTGIGAGLGFLLDKITSDPGAFTFWGGLLGFTLMSGVLYYLREYILYMVKAGHIAVVVKLLEDKPIPDGKSQITFATDEVKSRFKESSILFALDQLIKGVLNTLNRLLVSISNFIPIPGLQGLVSFINSILRMSLTYVDEIILAHNIRTQSSNPWNGSRDALVLYAQNFGQLLKNAAVLSVLSWGVSFVIFLMVLAPIAGLVALFPGIAGFWSMMLALVFALSLKAAVVDPFAMISLMQAYFKLTENQQPNPEWTAKLDSASDKFRELSAKARAFVSNTVVMPAASSAGESAST